MPISFSLKLLLMFLGLATAAYLVICLFLYLWQTRMIFFPSAVIETTPANFGMPYEEVWVPVAQSGEAQSEERLHGWWIPAAGPEVGVVLYLHGNGVNIGANVGQSQRFHQLGLSVLLIDYRGYGRSQGLFPNEQRVYQDAEASWQYLLRERQVPPQQLLIYGHSLGGAIAIQLASQHPEAAGLIVQSSFTSIRTMIDRTARFDLFPIDRLLTQRFDSLAKVSQLQMPVLYIHGLADEDVPADMSQTLYAASPDPKQIYLVPMAGHNNVGETAGDDYLQVIQTFMNQSFRQKAADVRP